ncbi:hypothetical protein ACE14D_08430, partial [Streptomyces sp. Act-28]
AYGGLIGPAQAQQRRHAAEVARYRENPELLYLGVAPPGMRVSRADVGPARFDVEYRAARQDEFAHAALTVRPPLTPTPRCPEFRDRSLTCAVDAHGEMRTVRDLPGGDRALTLVRRHHGVEAEVTSQTLDEPGLRRLLDTLHPLSDAELGELIREKTLF